MAVSQAQEAVSQAEEVVSQAQEVESQAQEVESQAQEVESQAQEVESQVELWGLEQWGLKEDTLQVPLPFHCMPGKLVVDCSGSLTKRTRAEEHQAKKSTPHSCILIGKGTAAHREGNAQ